MSGFKTDPPRATVIIAAWNASATIGRAVESALAQVGPVEVVVVDDASSDCTAELVSSWARCEPRLTLLRQPENRGPAAARNRAIEETRAPWIAVLDADDMMAPDRLVRLVDRAEAEGVDFLADDIEKVAEADPDGPRRRLYSDTAIGEIDIDAATFIRANIFARVGRARGEMGFLKPVMRRAFLERHGLSYGDLRLGEDYDLYARALILGARFRLTDPHGYVAVVRPSSLSGKHPTAVHATMMAADRRMLAMPEANAETRAALREHMLEVHKEWAWRRMIDAGRARNPLAMAGCFKAPPEVAGDLARRLWEDLGLRLRRKTGAG